MIPFTVNAYDGDVDYSAPYLTVDPETGKLVTIDPRAEEAQQQSQAQHQATGSTSGSEATIMDGTTTGNPGSGVVAQTDGNNNNMVTDGQTASNSLVKPFIVTIILSGIIVLFIILSRRSKPAKAVETEDDGTSAGH